MTSAVHSPRLEKNIALALVAKDHAAIGTEAMVTTGTSPVACRIVPKPFYDPKKAIAAKS